MTTFDFYYRETWNKTLENIVKSGQVSESQIPYYSSRLVSLDDTSATVYVDTFINYSIMSDNKELIESCLEEVIGKRVKVNIYRENEVPEGTNDLPTSIFNDFFPRQIDPNQTFTNFVVGRSNAQAHLSAMTCASNLGLVYNPLFIYGNSGLGKTHLLNAVGNQVKVLYPNKKIGFISGLEFVEGVHKADVEKKYDEFKEVFHSLDVLLVDDIQFIAGKPKTHEMFFTVFNDLVSNKKQIFITCDRTPSEIKGLEERIISRFNQGLTVNIEAPEYETSINILKMEIENSANPNSIIVDEDVYNFLATNCSHDVRELKGAVNRLLFYSIEFSNEDHISLKLAIEAFKDQIKVSTNELSISTVRKAVCDYYNLTKQQITSATRTKNIANARHIAMYLCRKLLDAPYKEIGDEFGKRDHTTVMSACERVEKLIKTNPMYLKAINEIESQLK